MKHITTAGPIAAATLAFALGGCAIFPYEAGTRANEPASAANPAKPTRAREDIAPADLPDGVFVGIAMSGGGSRAANFSAAVLLELDRLGLLRHAAAISSVSGSSLTAAYYARYGADPGRWNTSAVQRVLIHDFDRDWTTRWLMPHNIVRYWLTPYDRSDIMKQVFDDVLFGGRDVRFEDLDPPGRTRLLINATSIAGGENFVFSDQSFEKLGSRLDRYPVSHAVMASAAFPAAFNSVTLEDYRRAAATPAGHLGRRKGFYKHLYDGGPSGNLGVNALKRVLFDVAREHPLRGCLLVLVDAYPLAQEKVNKGERDADLRSLLGYLVDENTLDAFDDLLKSQREEALRALGYPFDVPIGARSMWAYRPGAARDAGTPQELSCDVWHLAMQVENDPGKDPEIELLKERAAAQRSVVATTPQDDVDLYKKALNIATDFRLAHPAKGDPQELQDLLFTVAQRRVKAGEAWLKERLVRWGWTTR